jgi:hypothetical protein
VSSPGATLNVVRLPELQASYSKVTLVAPSFRTLYSVQLTPAVVVVDVVVVLVVVLVVVVVVEQSTIAIISPLAST